jgi:hypothetical protein
MTTKHAIAIWFVAISPLTEPVSSAVAAFQKTILIAAERSSPSTDWGPIGRSSRSDSPITSITRCQKWTRRPWSSVRPLTKVSRWTIFSAPSRFGTLLMNRPPIGWPERSQRLIVRLRTEPAARVARARMLLAYRDDPSFFAVSRASGVHHQTVQPCVERAIAHGALAALEDSTRPGREPVITVEARAWLVDLACRKAKELGCPHDEHPCDEAHQNEYSRTGRNDSPLLSAYAS